MAVSHRQCLVGVTPVSTSSVILVNCQNVVKRCKKNFLMQERNKRGIPKNLYSHGFS